MDSVEVAAAYYAGQEGHTEEKGRCLACGQDHQPHGCDTFKNLQPRERRRAIAAARACYICLLPGHIAAKCPAKKPCTRCYRFHHLLLHDDDRHGRGGGGDRPAGRTRAFVANGTEGPTLDEVTDRPCEDTTADVRAMAAEVGPPNCALRTLPVLLINKKNGRRETYNAFVDDGCSHALISARVAQELALVGQPIRTSIQGVGGHTISHPSQSVELQIQSLVGPAKRTFHAQVLPLPVGKLQPTDWSSHKTNFPHLQHINFLPPIPGKGIDILLGQACPDLLASKEEVVAGPQDPVARRTLLGWKAAGPQQPGVTMMPALFAYPVNLESIVPDMTRMPVHHRPEDHDLEKLVARTWEVARTKQDEELAPSPQQVRDRQRLEALSYRDDQGHVHAPVLWLDDPPRLPQNRAHCLQRLLSLETSKNFRNNEIRKAYAQQIKEWQDKGYVRNLGPEPTQARFYLSSTLR